MINRPYTIKKPIKAPRAFDMPLVTEKSYQATSYMLPDQTVFPCFIHYFSGQRCYYIVILGNEIVIKVIILCLNFYSDMKAITELQLSQVSFRVLSAFCITIFLSFTLFISQLVEKPSNMVRDGKIRWTSTI